MNSEAPVLEMKSLISTKTISPHIYYPFILTNEFLFSKEQQMDSLTAVIRSNKYDFIKMFCIANEDMFDWLMKSANAKHIIVCGHYPGIVNINKVIKSGYKSIEHLAGYAQIKESTELKTIIELTKQYEVYNCPPLEWDAIAANLQFFDDYKKGLIFANAPQHFIDTWNKQVENYTNAEGRDKTLQDKNAYLPVFNYKLKILKKLSDAGNLLLLGHRPRWPFSITWI